MKSPAVPFRSNKGKAEAERIFYESKKRLGVLSLSARPDHVLLWSHYADSHRGLCFRFKSEPDHPLGVAKPVLYQTERPVLNIFTQSMDEQIESALMTKADFWSYEQEWRIFDHERGPGAWSFPAFALDGVIFGANILPEAERAVRSWFINRGAPVEFMRAGIAEEQFRLTISAA